jgi:hypothetical protein
MSENLSNIKEGLTHSDFSDDKITKIDTEAVSSTSNKTDWAKISTNQLISSADSDLEILIIDNENIFGKNDIFLNEGAFLTGWKNTENRSARCIEIYDSSVLVECLIDKENKKYAEIEYNKSLFSGMELFVGKLLKICFFERLNQVMMEVIDNPHLIDQSDFPHIDLSKQFGNLVLKKRK